MYKVSDAYKESMKSPLRERGYIRISFGLVNQEAQANAQVSEGEFTRYSNSTKLFETSPFDMHYATLEENFTPVDGSMYFLPRKPPLGGYYNTGVVSEELVSDGEVSLTIRLNILPTDFKGITLNFGENYPIDFDLVSDAGQTVQIRDNHLSEFVTDEVFENTSALTLRVHSLKNPHGRLRLHYVQFGYGMVFGNDSVMSSTLDSYASPIGAEIPQIDFSVTLKNYDKFFNVDNPDSTINFLETGQEMDIYYGYQLPNGGGIEWLKGNHLLCAEWESDDHTATIRCHDVFRNMDSEYYQGAVMPGRSYYDLAVEVLQVAGVTDYSVDPYLQTVYTSNPLPIVKCKEALQIIANACRCSLTQTRDGAILIKPNFEPAIESTGTNPAAYSNPARVLDQHRKDEYTTLAQDYTIADGSMKFLPREHDGATLNTGYISEELSDADGKFSENPKFVVTQAVAYTRREVGMVFGQTLPSGIIIRTYKGETLVDEYEVEEEIVQELFIVRDFGEFDKMEIEFTGTAVPYNRLVLNNFYFGASIDFTMTRKDMTSSPKAIKSEQVKELIVPCYSYLSGNQEEDLFGEEVVVVAGETMTFYLNEPAYGYTASLENADGVEIVASGCYFVAVQFAQTGTFKLNIRGYRYKVTERYTRILLHDRGKTVKWENPLISDMGMAKDLAEWLAAYYSSAVEYEYDTRGNPELDVNDIIFQENDFLGDMKVAVYRATLNFNQAFSGKISARRLEG